MLKIVQLCIILTCFNVCWRHICLTEAAAHCAVLFLGAMYSFFYLLTYSVCHTYRVLLMIGCADVPRSATVVGSHLRASEAARMVIGGVQHGWHRRRPRMWTWRHSRRPWDWHAVRDRPHGVEQSRQHLLHELRSASSLHVRHVSRLLLQHQDIVHSCTSRPSTGPVPVAYWAKPLLIGRSAGWANGLSSHRSGFSSWSERKKELQWSCTLG